ncbi:hypothetical protein EZS27_018996 [termite gut metagenome]|uniref:Tetratricopeptide repeat protein n=1 Tax=termite gut metagenome TaxID=433724 RepID=A0A5J4REM4_9ZZZZ
MKKKGILLFLFFFLLPGVSLFAQTLEQAKDMFVKKQYDKAKPVFQKYLKGSPTNANYNYWYGVCCLQTGEVEASIKPLRLAFEKKIQNASFFLGEAYKKLWYFDKAVKCYDTHIEILKKKNEKTDEVEKLLEESKLYARMLKGVEDVCVIDSFVVNKENFLEAYKISEESGRLYKYKDFFLKEGSDEATVYETELENIICYGERNEDNVLNIYTKIRISDGWSTATPFPDRINNLANVNYPFMLTDGVTVYYASDGDDSLGGYDMFVTRYNSGTESYMTPENIGMPFNSPFNDYMYVIDEYNNLGWFASDRYQPDNKVCVYVFVPNKFKKSYDYESMKHEDIVGLAQLRSLRITWKNEQIVTEAKSSLEKALLSRKPVEKKVFDFEFVIDDQRTYHNLNEFKSSRAREVFNKYRQLEKDYRQQMDKLTLLREQYAQGDKAKQAQLTSVIIDLERRVYEMSKELDVWAINTRYEEKK